MPDCRIPICEGKAKRKNQLCQSCIDAGVRLVAMGDPDEDWRQYPEDPNYEVSDKGRVRSMHRVITLRDGRRKTLWPKILEPWRDRGGYLIVSLGRAKKRLIHRMVATTFIPRPPGKDQVHHIDHDNSNNRVSNLEWVWPEEHYEYHARKRQEGTPEGR